MKTKLTILMPALNEEDAIAETIDTIPIKKLKKYDVEVLVIDGGSIDKTAENAKRKKARVVSSERGYGLQYKNGIKAAKGDIIITGDSDGTYPFEEIPKYLEIFEKNNLEFITVNRFAKLEKGSMKFLNLLGNKWLTFLTNMLFRAKIEDSQSGMWIMNKKAIGKLNLTSDGMPFSQEIKIEAFTKLRAREIKGFYKKRLGTTKLSKIKDGIKNTLFLFKKRILG